jgi:segregation and condensation protein A
VTPEVGGAMTYQLKLPIFEGPLDLLLHLCEKDQINIYDIPVARVTEQYLDYLFAMNELDLDIASEFIVMAATLLEIKARMLLPRAKPALVRDEPQVDPREELARHLAEYSRFKAAAGDLVQLASREAPYFAHPSEAPPVPSEALLSPTVSLFDLVLAFQKMLAAGMPGTPTEITREHLSVRRKMQEIIRRLASRRSGASFLDLVGPRRTRLMVVVTFLAVLELARQRRLMVQQPFAFAEMVVFYRRREEPGSQEDAHDPVS